MAPGICGPKSARRYLIIVNIISAIVGLIFLIVGSVSLSLGGSWRNAFDAFCKDECLTQGCTNKVCSEAIPACDCSTMKTTVPTYFFTAPAAGIVSVGVFSLLSSVLGCFAAIRMRAAWLCGYIIMLVFVIILQFAFGIAAAALGNVERIPDAMGTILVEDYKEIDWQYFSAMLPSACYAAQSTYTTGELVHHPACFWNGTCDGDSRNSMQNVHNVDCCLPSGQCDFEGHRDLCSSPQRCLGGFLANVGTPVAAAALLTIFLQIAAIAWACVIRRETRPGGVFDPRANQL
mmetsp:Transcript_28591/g.70754  ORF Transcript_28591/g.70754 Transcript_28591/m.70754 type:complete len:290 (+) Transcript_28591:97-966(+)